MQEKPCDAACQDAEKRKVEREEDDLRAQNSMADAAYIMAALTGAQLLIGGVTLIFLVRTFNETKRTANAAIKAADAAADSIKVTRDHVERAYVFGGPGKTKISFNETKQTSTVWITATHENYGKTPAFVKRIFLEHCSEADLPPVPEYRNEIGLFDYLPPDHEVRPIKRAKCSFPVEAGHMVYGRIEYVDVFHIERYSGFLHRYDADGNGHVVTDEKYKAYWLWN